MSRVSERNEGRLEYLNGFFGPTVHKNGVT